VIAEYLLDCPWPGRTRHVWALKNLEAWTWSVLYYCKELSLGDQLLIHKYFDPLKSARFAFNILNGQRSELDKLAREFAETIPAQIEAKRAAFAAAEAQREEEERAFKAWEADCKINGFKVSLAYRAQVLVDYLAPLPPDDPKRLEYAALLESLQEGQEPLENVFPEPPLHGAEPPPPQN
jgi:hypothetical protein